MAPVAPPPLVPLAPDEYPPEKPPAAPWIRPVTDTGPGPDALRFPGLYDPVEPAEEDDDPEPLNLDSSQAARTS